MENAVHLVSQKSDFAIAHLLAKDLVDDLQSTVLTTTDSLDTRINAEKTRVDDILNLSTAELNSFKEITTTSSRQNRLREGTLIQLFKDDWIWLRQTLGLQALGLRTTM